MHTILYADHTAKIGGGEIALLNLVRGLDKSRFRPVLALADDGPLVERFKDANIETVVLPLDQDVVNTRKESLGAGSLTKVRQISSVIGYARRLAGYAREIEAEIIHTNSLKSDIYGGLAGRIAGIPVIWHVRDGINSSYLPGPVAPVFRLLARFVPTLVVSNSQSTLGTLRLPAGRPSGVVYSGVDLSRSVGLLDPKSRANSAPIVALVGRIAPWKGQHVFIEAAANIVKRYPDCRFQIIGAPLFGEDDYLASLHTLAAERGVAGSVEFLGFRTDVSELVDDADIMVHASVLGEPFGQVVVEAMAAGKPVVATDGGALPEIVVEGETGFLTPMGDAGEMAKAIVNLLDNPILAREMGMAGRRRVEGKFTIQQSVAKIQDLYASLLSSDRESGIPEPARSM